MNTNVGPRYLLAFSYDPKGRRIQKVVLTNNGSAYIGQYTNNFLYDGWNLIAELRNPNSPLRTYMWGSDLSGSMQGAGGVGGLLEVTYYSGSATTNCFPAFDGNGNVAALINAADGTVIANYEYGPFGEVIRATVPMAKANPLRFSTKYDDDESDLLYYGYRYYKSSTGTWPNRDPMGEQESANLYTIVGNDSIIQADSLGECCCCCASDLSFDSVKAFNYGGLFGHDFVLSVVIEYRLVGPKGECTFTLKEKADNPPDETVKTGAKPNQWYDITTMPGSLAGIKWGTHDILCPGVVGLGIPDSPSITTERDHGRVMHFEATLKSSAGCKCEHDSITKTATQTLKVGHDGNIAIQTFK